MEAFVIKVKYGETLRRFSSPLLKVNGELALDMAGLRAKVISLFDFGADADMILTYVDEDGDAVTLADDNDLLEVTNQQLKCLRIDVKLRSEKLGSSSSLSSGRTDPRKTPNVQNPFSQINPNIFNEVVRSMPEPLCETIAKLSADLASKAACSSPVVGEILECFSKMGQSYLNMAKQPSGSATSENHAGGAVEKSAAKDDGLNEVPPETSCTDPKMGASCHFGPFSLNLDGWSSAFGGDKKEANEACSKRKSACAQGESGCSTVVVDASQSPNNSNFDSLTHNECPFSGIPVGEQQNMTPLYLHPHGGPFKRSISRNFWASLGIFHKGIRCDGCGVLPITGPRFKSKVKEDYDLCSICFSHMAGNKEDYVRIDKPFSLRHSRRLKETCASAHGLNPRVPVPLKFGRQHSHVPAASPVPAPPKLDSRFVFDVNVLDGTVMAPCTQFTKIWRMRNNGSLLWPQGTQLVWIGGDMFSSSNSVVLEIPPSGVPVDGELDIAVDFTAPSLPGRYISSWRMASPSGPKFGQRVWVLIQVDDSLKETVVNSFHGLNLNDPPQADSCSDLGTIDLNVQSGTNKRVRPVSTEQTGNVEPNSNANNTVLVDVSDFGPTALNANNTVLVDVSDFGPTAPQTPAAEPAARPSSVTYPIIDMSGSVSSGTPQERLDPSEVRTPPETAEIEVEEAMLRELEEMGFKQIDLNKEVLRRNEYDLGRSVDTLCGVISDWDPILEELQEMGFHDQETNRRLLKKNGGSIKRVVMDLLTGDKA